jgi:hypothetical protein
MVSFTSLDNDCCEGCLESWSISLRLKDYGVVFCAMVGVIAMIHAVPRLECVWASAATAAPA